MADKETHTSENAKLYELGFHLLPTIGEDKVNDAFSNVTGIISKNGGEIIKSGEPQAIKLAYTITKKIKTQNERFKTAYFAWVKFNSSSSDVEKIKEEVDQDENILRYIIVKTVDDDEHSTIKLVNEKDEDSEDGLEEADESEMDSEIVETVENKNEDDNDDDVNSGDADSSDTNTDSKDAEIAEEKTEDSSNEESDENTEEAKKDIDQIDEVIEDLSK